MANEYFTNQIKQKVSEVYLKYALELNNDIFNENSIIDNENLTVNQKNNPFDKVTNDFLIDLKDILNQTNSTIPELNRKISDLEVKISRSDLDNKNLVALYSATNIAKYSSAYWNEKNNIVNWDLISNNSTIQNNTSALRVDPIIAGDVAGGVGAAAGAWAVNVIVGPGTVAYGTAIIAGTVAGSVRAAILSWWP